MAMTARPPAVPQHHHAAGVGSSGQDDAEPDALEIVQFARYLGMDPIEDCAFLWIAEQALVAPLPDDWSEHMDAEGNVYYYNVVTDESSWEHPMDQYYRNLFLKVQREHEEKKAKEEEERRREEMERQDREKAARLMEEERLLARDKAQQRRLQNDRLPPPSPPPPSPPPPVKAAEGTIVEEIRQYQQA